MASCEDVLVEAGARKLIRIGIRIATPPNTYARIAPRSGLTLKHCLDIGAGVVDGDYRGEVGIIVVNNSHTDYQIHAKDRIAQLILERISPASPKQVASLDSTQRADDGFGSTGTTATTTVTNTTNTPKAKRMRFKVKPEIRSIEANEHYYPPPKDVVIVTMG